MSDTIEIPSGFPPLPEPPAGHHWVPRGWRWASEKATCYTYCRSKIDFWCSPQLCWAYGSDLFYVEAVPHPDQREEVVKLEAENSELREALTWQPIETAPKDGTKILALLKDSDVPHSIYFKQRYTWCISWDHHILSDADGPTHWMPIPALAQNGKEDA